MADRQWYTAIGGQQAGPYSDQRLGEMIASGAVRADTFVWCAGMTDWATAGDIPGLIPRARPTPPPPPRPGPPQAPRGPARAAAPRQAGGQAPFQGQRPFQGQPQDQASSQGQAFAQSQAFSMDEMSQAFSSQTPADAEALTTHISMWPLLGRAILVAIGQITVIPSPWTMTNFYQWFFDNLELPGQQRVGFTGKPMDIWYVFMAAAGLTYLSYILRHLVFIPFLWRLSGYTWLVTVPLSVLFLLLILQWILRNVVWEGQSGPLTFTGSYLSLLGWYVLTIISAITIIGWAWVAAAWIRWMCRHIEGGNRQLFFTAGGLDILWRSWLFILSCIVIIPIPWTLYWLTTWYVSQFALSHERAPA